MDTRGEPAGSGGAGGEPAGSGGAGAAGCDFEPCGPDTFGDGTEAPDSVDVAIRAEFDSPSARIDGPKWFGLAHYPPAADRAFYLPKIKAAGIHTIRHDLFLQDVIPASKCGDLATWNQVKDDPSWWNSLDYSPIDGWLDDARSNGFRAIGILSYIPAFLSGRPADQEFHLYVPAPSNTAAWTAWGELCQRIIRRYKDKLDAIEVHNEAEFFSHGVEAGYASNAAAAPDLYHYAAGPIRSVTTLELGGPAAFVTFAPNALDTLPVDPRSTATSADFMPIHLYVSDLNSLMNELDLARQKIDGSSGSPPTHWAGKPIWVTEWFTSYGDVSQKTAWFGFVIAELLRRGMPNVVYNYSNLLAESAPAFWVLPWKALRYAKVTEDQAAEVVQTFYETGIEPGVLNSVGVRLSNGARVVLSSNNSADYRPTLWRLMGDTSSEQPVCRFWSMSPASEAGPRGIIASSKACSRVSANEVDVKLWLEPFTTMVFYVD